MKQQYYRRISLSQLELNDGQLEGLPKNPRFIKDEKFNDLVRSIEQSPEFLEARPLLVYQYAKGRYIAIAGNMRLRACRALKMPDAPCYVFPKETPLVKLREYAIKDNMAYGQIDWDVLANEWEPSELKEWAFELPDGWLGEELPPLEGEPKELTSEAKNKPFVIKVVCEDEQQLKDFAQDIQQLIDEKYHGADYSVSAGEL